MNLLVIGRRFNKKNPEKLGGVVVLFEQLLKDLDALGVKHDVIDTNRRNYSNSFIAFFSISLQLLLKVPKYRNTIFNGVSTEYYLFIPQAVLWKIIFGRKIYLRKFGGNFDILYENFSFLKKKLVEFSLKNSTLLFFETKHLVNYFSKFNTCHWFPNVRGTNLELGNDKLFGKNYVFLGQIKETKGIKQIIEARKKLSLKYLIHIYGPAYDTEFLNSEELEVFNSIYKGHVDPLSVMETLNKYDVLILPTFHEGEGYPGVIIEAYSLGMPVISTRWNSIPEIVIDKETGILISIRNTEELCNAIQSFSEDNISHFKRNVERFFLYFDNIENTKKMLSLIK